MISALSGSSKSLPDWRRDPKLLALRERRDRVDERASTVADAIATAQHALTEARETDQRRAADLLLGRSTEAPAQAPGIETSIDKLIAEMRVVTRERGAFDAALAILENEAMDSAAAALSKHYRALVKRLDGALGEASGLAEECERVHALAAAQFDGTDGRPVAAGLPPVGWPSLAVTGQLAKRGSPNPSALEAFRTRFGEQGW